MNIYVKNLSFVSILGFIVGLIGCNSGGGNSIVSDDNGHDAPTLPTNISWHSHGSANSYLHTAGSPKGGYSRFLGYYHGAMYYANLATNTYTLDVYSYPIMFNQSFETNDGFYPVVPSLVASESQIQLPPTVLGTQFNLLMGGTIDSSTGDIVLLAGNTKYSNPSLLKVSLQSNTVESALIFSPEILPNFNVTTYSGDQDSQWTTDTILKQIVPNNYIVAYFTPNNSQTAKQQVVFRTVTVEWGENSKVSAGSWSDSLDVSGISKKPLNFIALSAEGSKVGYKPRVGVLVFSRNNENFWVADNINRDLAGESLTEFSTFSNRINEGNLYLAPDVMEVLVAHGYNYADSGDYPSMQGYLLTHDTETGKYSYLYKSTSDALFYNEFKQIPHSSQNGYISYNFNEPALWGEMSSAGSPISLNESVKPLTLSLDIVGAVCMSFNDDDGNQKITISPIAATDPFGALNSNASLANVRASFAAFSPIAYAVNDLADSGSSYITQVSFDLQNNYNQQTTTSPGFSLFGGLFTAGLASVTGSGSYVELRNYNIVESSARYSTILNTNSQVNAVASIGESVQYSATSSYIGQYITVPNYLVGLNSESTSCHKSIVSGRCAQDIVNQLDNILEPLPTTDSPGYVITLDNSYVAGYFNSSSGFLQVSSSLNTGSSWSVGGSVSTGDIPDMQNIIGVDFNYTNSITSSTTKSLTMYGVGSGIDAYIITGKYLNGTAFPSGAVVFKLGNGGDSPNISH